jgi:hypothetical protein
VEHEIDREGKLIRAWLSYALWVPAVETAELARLLGMLGAVGGPIQANCAEARGRNVMTGAEVQETLSGKLRRPFGITGSTPWRHYGAVRSYAREGGAKDREMLIDFSQPWVYTRTSIHTRR